MSATEEIAAIAARLIVEEGLEYGPAKRRAAQSLGRLSRRPDLPSNDALEDAVREEIALFHAETQPGELAELREVAALWMERLAEFRPYLTGAVWRGTATRLSAVHLQLYCDDAKAAEIALINRGISYDLGSVRGPRGEVDVLRLDHRSEVLADVVPVLLTILDHDDLRGALKPDRQGRSDRGDHAALSALLAAHREAAPRAGNSDNDNDRNGNTCAPSAKGPKE